MYGQDSVFSNKNYMSLLWSSNLFSCMNLLTFRRYAAGGLLGMHGFQRRRRGMSIANAFPKTGKLRRSGIWFPCNAIAQIFHSKIYVAPTELKSLFLYESIDISPLRGYWLVRSLWLLLLTCRYAADDGMACLVFSAVCAICQ